MNIVEAYIKYAPQLVVFVSGISGCGKTTLAKNISDKFNINLLEQVHYYKKGYDKEVTLPDGTTVVNRYTDEAIDWVRLNKDINRMKKQGVVVSGFALVEDKISTTPDYHIHLSLSKQVCIDRRRRYLEKHKDKYPEEYKMAVTDTEKLKMNRLIFPYYLDSKNRSKFDKVLNINEMTDEDVWDVSFKILINFISRNIDRVYDEWERRGGRDLVQEDSILAEPAVEDDDEEEPATESPEGKIQPMVEPSEQFPEPSTNSDLEEVSDSLDEYY